MTDRRRPRPFPLALLAAALPLGCDSADTAPAYSAAVEMADEPAPASPGPAANGDAAEPLSPADAVLAVTPDDEPPSEAEEDEEFMGGFVTPAAATEPDPNAPPPGSPAALAAMSDQPAEPRDLRLLLPVRTFQPAGDGAVRVSFDDLDLLKVLNAEPVPADVVEQFPDWLAGLDGKTVRLRGFMYPTYADPVRAFILARDNQICCFGRNPKPYDLVTVKLADGEESRYIQNRPFDVVGTFRIDPRREGEDWLRLYRIDAARVIE